MSVTRTFTVTVVSTGSGNKYFIDGVQQDTVYLAEGRTYRFDQSDSTNGSHPLRFSTTSDGTHNSGSEYTTGVTTNGTPGQAGAYTQITVATSAPTLYYYCTNHSGMGGQADTPISSYSRTFTVTVANPGAGNRYYIDGVLQDTVSLAEGYTYIFDQSDSSNGTHPLRFSTTSDGTHNSGSEYTTGVTTNGTAGSSGAYTQITVAASAPTLYYYCTNHSGMGGQANTPASDTWGLLSWNYNSWGAQDTANVFPTGLSATTAVGDGTNMGVPQTGWGGTSWSNGEWGQVNDNSAVLSGFGLTASLNADGLLSFQSSGWGRNTWNDGPFGESNDPVVSVTGLSMTSSVGDGTNMGVPQTGWGGQEWSVGEWGAVNDQGAELTGLSMTASLGTLEAYNEVGWGRDGWGEEAWGRANDATAVLEGFGLETGLGNSTWGAKGWGNNSWGLFALDDVASAMGLTGVSATGSVGTLSFEIDATFSLTGVSATSSVGAVEAADVEVPTGQSATSSVGSVVIETAYDITGVSATISLGSTDENSNPIITPTGISMTSSVGSLAPADIMGLTGLSATFSIGSPTVITSLDLALTGQSATSNVAAFGTASGFGIQAYQSIDTGSNTSYTDVA